MKYLHVEKGVTGPLLNSTLPDLWGRYLGENLMLGELNISLNFKKNRRHLNQCSDVRHISLAKVVNGQKAGSL